MSTYAFLKLHLMFAQNKLFSPPNRYSDNGGSKQTWRQVTLNYLDRIKPNLASAADGWVSSIFESIVPTR